MSNTHKQWRYLVTEIKHQFDAKDKKSIEEEV
jgi:hypothetical protein